MAGRRPARTAEERQRARAFVVYLASLADTTDPYDLADKAGLPRETVRGYWYGASVPDGIAMLELLRAANVVNADYRLPGREGLAAGALAAARAAEAAGDQALGREESPARRRRAGGE